jgi:hypothetical protein
MFLKKLYLLLIVYAALISISGCYAKEVGWMGWANTSPAEIKEGQLIRLQAKEERLIDVYPGDGTENPQKIKTDQLAITIVAKDAFGISGVLVEAYDFSTMSYIQNNNTDHVIEIKFDEIGDLGLWESKLIRKDSGIEDSAVGAVVEILGWLGALYLVLSIIF